MADLNHNRTWLTPEIDEVKKRWIKCEIQSRKSQIVRINQDIEDLLKGQIVKLEGIIMMLEKEIQQLEQDLKKIDNIIDVEIKK